MTRRLLDRDPLTGVDTWFEYRASTDTGVITHTQDVTPFLERNKIAQNDDEKTKRGIKRDWWKYASIPAAIWIGWRNEGLDIFNPDHQKAAFAKINDPEFRYLKTTTKHHQVKDGG
jgi:hypothetical protein